MKKTFDQRLDEMVEQACNGSLELIRFDPNSIQRDPVELKKAVEELKRLNETPLRKGVATRSRNILVSKSAYTRLARKAKRANLGVSEYIEKLAGE